MASTITGISLPLRYWKSDQNREGKIEIEGDSRRGEVTHRKRLQIKKYLHTGHGRGKEHLK